MTSPQVKIVNVETGEEFVRDANDLELEQIEKDATAAEARKLVQKQTEAKRLAAEAKLAALGLTADDLKALGL